MEVVALASGSKGNSWYVEVGGKHILIDAGISMKQLNTRLLQYVGVDLDDIEFIFITHRHSDHVQSLNAIMNKYEHIKFLAPKIVFDEYSKEYRRFIPQNRRIDLTENYNLQGKAFDVSNQRINHDVACFAYKFTDNVTNESFLFLADNGGIKKNSIRQWMKGCTYYAIESNHDLTKQIFSERHEGLKRRVLGYYGHTHNAEAYDTMINVITGETKGVMFHHLSDECNSEELAKATHDELTKIWGNVTALKEIDIKYARQGEGVRLV